MNGDPVPVVLIGGYSRSGSTLLARILAEVEGVVAAGEIRYLWRRGLMENRRCDCGEPCRSCPFWQKVMARAFGGIDAVDPRRLLRLQAHIDRVHRIPSLVTTPEDDTAWELADYLSHYERLYRAIAEVSGARVVVDSSKDPSFGHVLARSRAVDLSVVHLVRDSRAVAHSWTRHKHDPGTGKAMARQPSWRSALEWDVANLAAVWLTRRVVRSTRLRYEDLTAEPRRAMAGVIDLLGVGEAPVEGNRVRLGSGHAVSGNPMRFDRGVVTIRNDDSWHREMAGTARAQVTALTWPGLLSFGYPLVLERS